jgi:thiamine biosynthesis lipoprotein
MRLDFGGIAKGYAADEMVKALRSGGHSRCLVAAGGDIVAGEPPPDASAWDVAIAPLGPGDLPPTLRLANAAVSTSGDAEQFVEIAGRRYAHIVDPKTGLGLTDRLAVTVVAPDGTTSDALATAAAVLGPKRGIELVESAPACAARFVRFVGERCEVVESAGWKHLLKRN